MNCFCKNCKEDEETHKKLLELYPDKYIMFVHIKSNKKWLKYLPTGTFYGTKTNICTEKPMTFHTNSIPIWNCLNESIKTSHKIGIEYVFYHGIFEVVKVY